ncbi:hypothetical protein HO173_012514 [Letharia columbiana]|uniref:Uncharacterized protein n=1 Tax=Letharia columbiana TaxID=112416 RepID=A0A8H6FFK1_9LECA|nr:uncharacterized protein HO173_012514 [Letharia columbiana]KAF6226024.1 hypothetical protein HO173_012514 [Letharia columbiana]
MKNIISIAVLAGLTTAYSGDLTYYAAGVGSCGVTNTDSDAIVALSLPMMANGGNPNTNPKCGSKISIHNPTSGQTAQATVVDSCAGCAMYDIDVSGSLFTTLAGGLSAGRVSVDWEFQGQVPKLKERRKNRLCWGSWIC